MSIGTVSTIALSTVVVIAIIVSIMLIKACNSNGKFKTDYDERQKIMIGKGYKYAMITTWVLLGICAVIKDGGMVLPVEDSMLIFSIIMVSVLIFTSYSVWTDAYWGKNNQLGKYAVLCVIITLINLAAVVASAVSGDLIVDGVLTFRGINAECAAMFIILGIEMFVKSIVDKKNGEEEDDDEES